MVNKAQTRLLDFCKLKPYLASKNQKMFLSSTSPFETLRQTNCVQYHLNCSWKTINHLRRVLVLSLISHISSNASFNRSQSWNSPLCNVTDCEILWKELHILFIIGMNNFQPFSSGSIEWITGTWGGPCSGWKRGNRWRNCSN